MCVVHYIETGNVSCTAYPPAIKRLGFWLDEQFTFCLENVLGTSRFLSFFSFFAAVTACSGLMKFRCCSRFRARNEQCSSFFNFFFFRRNDVVGSWRVACGQ